jgi:5'-methylthioadenosine phosphorylase
VIAIIGGTGVGRFPLDDGPFPLTIDTPYGAAVAATGSLRGKEVVFLARHGAGHRLPPHRINYRANIAALRQIGVQAVLATTAVGSLNTHLKTGDLVLLDDLIDFTRDRSGKTFFDGEGEAPVVHTDFTFPYSPDLREIVLEAATALGIPIHRTGTYLCNDGPRYETPAEVRLFAAWGADVVGMTGVPEATLAREAGLHYAGVSLVTNLAAGLSTGPLTHTEVEAAMAQAGPGVQNLLAETVARTDILPPIGPGVPLPGLTSPAPVPS